MIRGLVSFFMSLAFVLLLNFAVSLADNNRHPDTTFSRDFRALSAIEHFSGF